MDVELLLPQITTLTLHAGRFARTPHRLALAGARPAGPQTLALEYRDPQGGVIAGQWSADPAELELNAVRLDAAGHGGHGILVNAGGTILLLHVGGADLKLKPLAGLAATPGALVLRHQLERRGVVRIQGGGEVRFAKVIPPSKAVSAGKAGVLGATLGRDDFATPQLIEADCEAGTLWWSAVEGTSLYTLLGEPARLVQGWGQAGRVLAAFHRRAPECVAKIHDSDAEIAVNMAWLRRLELGFPRLAARLAPLERAVARRLSEAPTPHSIVHRDFHDKQVLVSHGHIPGLLDFDTLARGEPALDVANALVHLDLRALQGHCSPRARDAAKAGFLQAYRPDRRTVARLPAYEASTAFRLACVYSYRPGTRTIVQALIRRLCDSAQEVGTS